MVAHRRVAVGCFGVGEDVRARRDEDAAEFDVFGGDPQAGEGDRGGRANRRSRSTVRSLAEMPGSMTHANAYIGAPRSSHH